MKLKKTLCVILALVLCITATIVVVTANAKEASIQILSEKSQIAAGDSTTISVKVTTNFPVATMSIPVFYDKTMLSVSDATATLTDYSVKSTTTDAQSVDSSKIYANTNISEENYGFVLVTYIGSAGTNVAASIDEVVLTFEITAKTDVIGEAVVKCVTESVKTTDNIAGMLYFGSPTSGNTINSVPENIEKINFDEANQTISISQQSSGRPELVLSEYGAEMGAVIDTDICTTEYTGAVYGIDTLAGESLEDYFTTPAGEIEIIENDNGAFSTGAVVNLLDEDGNVVETYVFIYFGDVNGDEAVDISDAGDVEAHDQWVVTFEDDSPAYYAADVNFDGSVDISDAGDIEAQDQWVAELSSQAEIAAEIAVIY